MKRRAPKNESLRGTGLYRHPKSKILYWRGTDPISGKRLNRSTGTHVLEYALKKVQGWRDELEKKRAGIVTYEFWTKPLGPLLDGYLRSLEARTGKRRPTDRWIAQERSALVRAIGELGLRTLADLDDLRRLDAQLRSLPRKSSVLRRRFQEPLKRLSAWLAGNRRHLPHDPLGSWELIGYEKQARHRCLDPGEIARALVAAGWLDQIKGRSLKTVFTTLLITAPRASALTTRDASDVHEEEGGLRIDYGEGRGKKSRGQGKLDAATAEELRSYLGARVSGPLFPSPRGQRLRPDRLLEWWREAFGLGVVSLLWPEERPLNVEDAYLVNQALLTGRPKVGGAGNPNQIRAETRKAWRDREREILAQAEEIKRDWAVHMDRVTVHSFRHTHQTWALAAGVDQHLINLQLGWGAARTPNMDVLRVANLTGQRHYLDQQSSVLDARKSAEAVRGMLDAALLKVEDELDRRTRAEPGRDLLRTG